MIRFVLDPVDPDPQSIAAAADALRQGAVVAFPTDTLYGLAVDPQSDRAVDRLFALKGREGSAAVALIAADAGQAGQAGTFGPDEERLAGRFWPGALTIVVRRSPAMSPLLSGDRGTLGVRVPAHALARALAAAFGGCVTATSANRSGRPAALTADAVAAAFGDELDVLLDGGPAPGGAPSTIVEIVEGRPMLHRAGAVAWDRVIESLPR
jgi:L-threonylcarbamoyladenylate synthase